MSNCQARQLIRDGRVVTGIGYDMNFIGSSCRQSVNPGTDDACNWCSGTGPTLPIRYDAMTVQYLADPEDDTVRRYATSLPDGTGSSSRGGNEMILFANGTVYYTFNQSLDNTACLSSAVTMLSGRAAAPAGS